MKRTRWCNLRRFHTALLLAAVALKCAAATAYNSPDPMFAKPYIDIDEWREKPVRHHYVHGGFKGTDTRFSFYLPPKKQYQGRFYQYITPVPDNENLSQGATGEEDRIGFAIASGAYFIETNGGGSAGMAVPGLKVDPLIGAYRANAAVARYSRVVAQQFYNTKQRPYGYAFGGSGGAFRTIGGFENTSGVWDGVVPYVMGSPMAIPNVFSVRMYAMRVLKDKFPQILDAVEPGGSGDMYAGLNDEQREALREVTRMGFPPRSWFGYKTMGVHAFTILYPAIVRSDPGYFTDFWTKPGYIGSNPPESLTKARLQYRSKIKEAINAAEAKRRHLEVGRMAGQHHKVGPQQGDNKTRGSADKAWQQMEAQAAKTPIAFQLEGTPPDVGFLGGDMIVLSGAAKGKTLEVRQLNGDVAIIGVADPRVLEMIKPGDEVKIDNSNFLAAQTYHRHQVPGPEYPVWNQFRDAAGKPLYPQRPMLLGPIFTATAAGAVPAGKFEGKMILVESLWDREAFPWQADWYRDRVKQHLGDKTDDYFRLWYTDHALHGDFTRQEDPTHTVSYIGVLQQALRDLAAWVEKGVAPPATTHYRVDDGQIVVPPTAEARKGIQPVLTLTANGAERADVNVGEPVQFYAVVDVPPKTGVVVSAEWHFEGGVGDGADAYPVHESLDKKALSDHLEIRRTYTFSKPGTYFPTLRVASQRNGDTATPFARVQNLKRVRVVVK